MYNIEWVLVLVYVSFSYSTIHIEYIASSNHVGFIVFKPKFFGIYWVPYKKCLVRKERRCPQAQRRRWSDCLRRCDVGITRHAALSWRCGVDIITRRAAVWTLYRCHLYLPFSLVMMSHNSQDNHYNPKREGSELGKRCSLCLKTFPQLNRNKCVITLAAVSAVTFAATRVGFVCSASTRPARIPVSTI